MLYSKFFIPTAREVPKDAVIPSHVLMIRAGLIKKVASGIYSLLPLGYRVIRKIEQIIREEMDRIGSNEFFLPVIIPAELWKTSDRWYSMGPELFRLKDRGLQEAVLAPTHEEVFTYILKDHIKSYRDLPLSVYQIGLKFRDEIRPRFGVMRGKTFIMKDAYSFHRESDPGSLDRTYRDMAGAYRRIFKRCGLETVPVAADSGAMGGSASEEFMVPSQVGEEEILQCSCGYASNREKAAASVQHIEYRDSGALELVHTPNVKTIEDLARFLGVDRTHLIKSIVYKIPAGDFVLAVIRGDLDINETKLRNHLSVSELLYPDEEEVRKSLNIPLGFVGPVGLKGIRIVADLSVKGIKGGVTGSNRADYHFKNVDASRDFITDGYADIRLVRGGDSCPVCGKPLAQFRGIELGHIFKLGDKYARAFSVAYLDEDSQMKTPIMGCYGIGVERTAAAVIEQNHDERGIIWPISVSPFHAALVPIKYSGRTKEAADRIASELSLFGCEALVDDRDERPGVKYNDADLIGIPYRVTVGDRDLKEGLVKLTIRRTGENEQVGVEHVARRLKQLVDAGMKTLCGA